MPRRVLTQNLASATVRYLRINADQTTDELTAAQMLAALGGQKSGVQYLTANAVWDGSPIVTTDGNGPYNLSVAGVTGGYSFTVDAIIGDITITNSPSGFIDGTISGGAALAWVNNSQSAGSLTSLA